MGKMWKYEPEDFDENGNRKDGKDKPAASHRDSRQLKDYIPSAGKGFEGGTPTDNDGNPIHPEPKGPKYPPLNKNTWDH
jgi:hypothetical protein